MCVSCQDKLKLGKNNFVNNQSCSGFFAGILRSQIYNCFNPAYTHSLHFQIFIVEVIANKWSLYHEKKII